MSFIRHRRATSPNKFEYRNVYATNRIDVGLSEYCIDLNELSEKTLFAKFGQLEANHDAYKNRLKNIHSDMKQQAYKTTEIVVNFLQEKGVTNLLCLRF